MHFRIKTLTLFASSLLLSSAMLGNLSQPVHAETNTFRLAQSDARILSTPGGLATEGQDLYTPQVNPGSDAGLSNGLEPGATAGDIPALGEYYDARNQGGIDLGVERSQQRLPVAKQNQITDQTLMTSPVDQQLNNVTIDNPAHLEADADDADPANSPASQTLFWLAVAGLTVSIMTLGYLAYRKQEQPFQ